ncbi:MAG: hypothetical protein ACLQUT_05460 [Thermoleophilia bacterium]
MRSHPFRQLASLASLLILTAAVVGVLPAAAQAKLQPLQTSTNARLTALLMTGAVSSGATNIAANTVPSRPAGVNAPVGGSVVLVGGRGLVQPRNAAGTTSPIIVVVGGLALAAILAAIVIATERDVRKPRPQPQAKPQLRSISGQPSSESEDERPRKAA